MAKFHKLVWALMSGAKERNFTFADLVSILLGLGFVLKSIRGSHHVFYRDGIPDILIIQPADGKAKPYQVQQIRDVILKYKLWNDGWETE